MSDLIFTSYCPTVIYCTVYIALIACKWSCVSEAVDISIPTWPFSLGSPYGFVFSVDTGQAFCYSLVHEVYFLYWCSLIPYHRLSPYISLYCFPGTWSKCCLWCMLWAVGVCRYSMSTDINFMFKNLTYEVFFKKKGEVHPGTGREGPEGSSGIAVFFL